MRPRLVAERAGDDRDDTATNSADRPALRLGSRFGCSEAARATLSYQYSHAQVWLDDLSEERNPHDYDLCARHAGRLTAPRGWSVLDRRLGDAPSLLAV